MLQLIWGLKAIYIFIAYTYEFTYEQPATAEGIINIRKGYKVKELDNTTGRPLTNKDDDF